MKSLLLNLPDGKNDRRGKNVIKRIGTELKSLNLVPISFDSIIRSFFEQRLAYASAGASAAASSAGAASASAAAALAAAFFSATF